jgi:hypothetical protein
MIGRPIWKAAVVAPLGAPLSIVVAAAWESVSHFGLSGLRDLPATMLLAFLLGLPVGYGAMLLLGMPYLIWLRSKGCTRIRLGRLSGLWLASFSAWSQDCQAESDRRAMMSIRRVVTSLLIFAAIRSIAAGRYRTEEFVLPSKVG